MTGHAVFREIDFHDSSARLAEVRERRKRHRKKCLLMDPLPYRPASDPFVVIGACHGEPKIPVVLFSDHGIAVTHLTNCTRHTFASEAIHQAVIQPRT